MRDDIEPRLKDVFLVNQYDVGSSSAEEYRKDFLELFPESIEGLAKLFPRRRIYAGDGLFEFGDGQGKVLLLFGEKVVPCLQLLVFLNSLNIDRAHRLQGFIEFGYFFLVFLLIEAIDIYLFLINLDTVFLHYRNFDVFESDLVLGEFGIIVGQFL